MTTRDKVDKINKKIKELNKKLTQIQLDCPHTNTKEITSTYRIGASCPAIVCMDCDKIIRTDFNLAFKAEGFTELELAYAQGRIKKEK